MEEENFEEDEQKGSSIPPHDTNPSRSVPVQPEPEDLDYEPTPEEQHTRQLLEDLYAAEEASVEEAEAIPKPSIPGGPSAEEDWGLEPEKKEEEKEIPHQAGVEGCTEQEVLDAIEKSYYDGCLMEARRRLYQFVDELFAYFPCSVGAGVAHVANGPCRPRNPAESTCDREKKKLPSRIFASQHGGDSPDKLRLNLLHVGPPGVSKNLFMDFFTEEGSGMLWGPNGNYVIPCTGMVKVTSAAFFGTITRDSKGRQNVNYGAAHRFCSGIISAEELETLRSGGKGGYNADMMPILLIALDKGSVQVNMASGSFGYPTKFSFWTATQVANVWLGGGFDRRFCILYKTLLRHEERLLKMLLHLSKKIPRRPRISAALRKKGRELYEGFGRDLREVVYTERFSEYVLKVVGPEIGDSMMHYEMQVLYNIGLGYYVSRFWKPGMKVLEIDLDEDLKRLIDREVEWRCRVTRYENVADFEIRRRLKEPDRIQNGVHYVALLKELQFLAGIEQDRSKRTLKEMAAEGIVEISGRGDDRVVKISV